MQLSKSSAISDRTRHTSADSSVIVTPDAPRFLACRGSPYSLFEPTKLLISLKESIGSNRRLLRPNRWRTGVPTRIEPAYCRIVRRGRSDCGVLMKSESRRFPACKTRS